jgi:hypothetical protein
MQRKNISLKQFVQSLTTKEIRAWAGSTIYGRGKEYFQNDQVESIEIEQHQNEYEISAAVEGSSDDYWVSIKEKSRTIHIDCDCPYDGMPCKHIVAVLLALEDDKANYAKMIEEIPTTQAKTENNPDMAKKTIQEILRELTGIGFDVKKGTQAQTATAKKQEVAQPVYKNTPAYNTVREAIERNYDVLSLKRFQKDYLIPFVDQHISALTTNPYLLTNYKETKSVVKATLVNLKAYLYADEAVFKLFLNWLPVEIRQSIEAVIWRGGISPEEMKAEFNFDVITPLQKKNYYYYEPKGEIKEIGTTFFVLNTLSRQEIGYYYGNAPQPSNKYYCKFSHQLTYPSAMLAVLRTYLPTPTLATTQIPENTPIFQGEDNISSLFNYAITYMEQGKLELTKAGNISAAQITKFQKFLNLPEIFPAHTDKLLANMRTKIWAEWLGNYILDGYGNRADLDKNILQYSFQDLSRKLWKDFPKFCYTMSFMTHLKGNGQSMTLRYHEAVCKIVQKLPLNSWIDIKTLFENETFAQSLPMPIDPTYLNYLKAENGEQHIVVGTPNSKILLEKPVFYAAMASMAGMGWLDLTFQEGLIPPKSIWAIENGLATDYISYFEVLSAIRITPLGAYTMGMTNTYTLQEIEEELPQLDENSLYIFYNGKNASLRAIIQQTARLVGKDLYKVDYESVLGDCANYKQVQSKINIFKKLLSANPPKVWKDFFQQLNQKSYEFKVQNDEYFVFSLPQNTELINTIAREPNLKKYILKAEGYMILIRKKDLNNVKKQLKSYGFLVDFLGIE